MLSHHEHGKGRVRVVKVNRHENGVHEVMQMNVKVIVEGNEEVAASYFTGNNSSVLPTDSIKNTVYVLAKSKSFDSIEEFGTLVSRYFVTEHSKQIKKATVIIVQDNWTRIVAPDAQNELKPHHHAFVVQGSSIRSTTVVATRLVPHVTIASRLSGLKVMKTTQSSFTGFLKDQYTTLPEVSDRLVGTVITATWTYASDPDDKVFHGSSSPDYNARAASVKTALLQAFSGPAEVGVASPAVQFTLYQMATAVLKEVPSVMAVTLNLPNVHNLPLDQSKFGLLNVHPHGEIFVPVDEPHGIIEATVTRESRESSACRLPRSNL